MSARRDGGRIWRIGALLAVLVGGQALAAARAETMSEALARAFAVNPDLNQQRAAVRVALENVPIAAAALRPRAAAAASIGRERQVKSGEPLDTPLQASLETPQSYELTVDQTLFDGQRAGGAIRQAEAGVAAARETLRQSEAEALQAAATAYMDVLRDRAVVRLDSRNVEALEAEVRDARARFAAGEVLWTDVAQAQTALGLARAERALAQAGLVASEAAYRRATGAPPGGVRPARSLEALLPANRDDAIGLALERHPAVRAAQARMEGARAAVAAAEAALAPLVAARGALQRQIAVDNGIPVTDSMASAGVAVGIAVPLYQGGAEYAAVRQAKAQQEGARQEIEAQRRAARAGVESAWAQLEAARSAIVAQQQAVKASEFSLFGLREEAKDGMRTTLDILNAHQALLSARTALLAAQRDRVVSSYAALAAIGLLSSARLGLDAAGGGAPRR